MQDRWRRVSESSLIEIIGIVLFAALVALVAGFAPPGLSGVGLVVASLVLALIPAAIWLVAFYRQDRVEPEPKQMVFGVFVLGALLAAAVGQPLIRDLFQYQEWFRRDATLGFLGSILIVGIVQEFCKYAAVRYTVFNSAEFDQPVDGIIYAAAAGLGYATTLNIQYVIGNGGVDLGIGSLRVSIEALSQASTAGVLGYFMGQARFKKMGPIWLPIGLVLAAILNGVISTVLDILPTLGGRFGFNLWYGLIGAGLIAGVTFAILLTIINRLNAQLTRS